MVYEYCVRNSTGVPGIRSTFGTGSELLNTLRLMFSRLANHCCPNGHYLEPTLDVAAGKELCCPGCGAQFFATLILESLIPALKSMINGTKLPSEPWLSDLR